VVFSMGGTVVARIITGCEGVVGLRIGMGESMSRFLRGDVDFLDGGFEEFDGA